MIKVLELFSGTGSVKKCCDKLGWDCVSVDIESKYNPTHCISIMDFDYKKYNNFDIIWGSPPCVEYSNLKSCWLGKKLKDGSIYTKEVQEKLMKDADLLVSKTFEIINYFQPYLWFVENPQTSRLKDRKIMKDIPYYDFDYCMYSDWGYRKRTRVWTNKKDFEPLTCDNSGSCGNMLEILTDGAVRHDSGKPLKCDTRKLHNTNCGKSETLRAIRKHSISSDGGKKNGKGTRREDRYRIPEELIFNLFLATS